MLKIFLALLLLLSNLLYANLMWEFEKEYLMAKKECDFKKIFKIESEYYQKALGLINKKEEKYTAHTILTVFFFDNLKVGNFEEAKNALKNLENLVKKYKFLRKLYNMQKHNYKIAFHYYNKEFKKACLYWKKWKKEIKKNYMAIGYIINSAIIINDKEILSEIIKIKKLKDEEKIILNYFLSNGKIKPKEKPQIVRSKNLYSYIVGEIDKNHLIESLKNEGECAEFYKAQYECIKLFCQSLP